MPLNYVTLTLDLYDGTGNYPVSGTASFVPSAVLTDAGVEIVGQQPIVVSFHAAGLPAAKLLATDNAGVQPSGWGWTVAFSGITGAPAAFSFFLPFAGGSSQLLSALMPVSGVIPAVITNVDGGDALGGSFPAGSLDGGHA